MRSMLIFGTDEGAKRKFLEGVLKDSEPLFTHKFGAERALGIDDVHEIKRRASIAPAGGSQAFVVERADEMTPEAHQAFLKLLEEPPAGSLFILLAVSSMLPATILSRVEKHTFFGGSGADESSMLLETIGSLREKFEAEIRTTKVVPSALMHSLSRALALLQLLNTSRVPRHSIEECARATIG